MADALALDAGHALREALAQILVVSVHLVSVRLVTTLPSGGDGVAQVQIIIGQRFIWPVRRD